jgi:hypothetical protein
MMHTMLFSQHGRGQHRGGDRCRRQKFQVCHDFFLFSFVSEANESVAPVSKRDASKRPLTETFHHIRSLTRDYILQQRFCMADIALCRSAATRIFYESGSLIVRCGSGDNDWR